MYYQVVGKKIATEKGESLQKIVECLHSETRTEEHGQSGKGRVIVISFIRVKKGKNLDRVEGERKEETTVKSEAEGGKSKKQVRE